SGHVVGSLLRATAVDAASPIVYGIPDTLTVYSDDGESFRVSNTMGRGEDDDDGGDDHTPRATGRGTADDPDVVQGRPALDPKFEAPPRPSVEPWEAEPVTDEQLQSPLNVIPPAQRPRVALRFVE